MHRYFCTYFDRNYFAKGLALIQSLTSIHGNNYTIFVVCMDELTRTLLNKINLPTVTTVPVHEIEENDKKLLEAKSNRSIVEYLWTTTSTIILRIIERNPKIDILTYVDADLYFYSSTASMYEELSTKSVLIHEHRFPPHLKAQEQYGKFNVGLLCFRNDQAGLEVLNWWRDRCIEWCYARVEDGKYGDQRYLDDWPTRFPCVCPTKNIGLGVAPWNTNQYQFKTNDLGQACVDNSPIVFYHFHSFTIINPALYIPASDPAYCPSVDSAKLCVLPYAYAIERSISKILEVQPDFTFGIMKNDFNLTSGHGFIARRELQPEIAKLGIPQQSLPLDGNWLWYEPVR